MNKSGRFAALAAVLSLMRLIFSSKKFANLLASSREGAPGSSVVRSDQFRQNGKCLLPTAPGYPDLEERLLSQHDETVDMISMLGEDLTMHLWASPSPASLIRSAKDARRLMSGVIHPASLN